MKVIITGLVMALFIYGLVWLINIQNEAFQQRREFVTQCAEAGGIISETKVGWVHSMLACGGIGTSSRQ